MKARAIALLFVGACAFDEPPGVRIQDPAPMLPGTTTRLAVPAYCPVYTPTGGDIDTPERPFPETIRSFCGVDASGIAYGLVTGDTGDLAILAGGQEIGMYIDFEGPIPSDALPSIKAWAAPVNVASLTDCCAEDAEGAQIPIRAVAVGASGLLLSFGRFDKRPTQIALELAWVGYWERFYVNAPPPL